MGAIGPDFGLAQSQAERPVGFEPRAFAIVNARLVVSPDEEIEQGTLVIRDGVIAAAGQEIEAPADAEVIDGQGLIVYPGFIDAGTSALLEPTRVPTPAAGRPIDFARSALAATPPDNRKGLTPEFEAHAALKSDAALWEARRKLGLTAVHVVPAGRLASGAGALLSTSGLPLRESLVVRSTMPEFQLLTLGGPGYPATMMGGVAHLRQAFLDAARHRTLQRLYAEQAPGVLAPPEDRVLEALVLASDARRTVLFAAQSRDEIHRALDFAQEHALPTAIWGGREAHRCLDRLGSESAGVILQVNWGAEPAIEPQKADETLTPEVKLPMRVQHDRRDRWREQVAGAKRLAEARVRLALCSEGTKEPEDFFKGLRQAVSAGLSRKAALAAITRDAALLLGQGIRLGTLAPGKLAHVVVFNGPFDDERSKVRLVFVDGLKFEYHRDAAPVPPSAGPGGSLAGSWQIEIEAADGKIPATLDITQTGAVLSGTFRSSQGEGRLSTGKLSGSAVEFTVSIGAGAQTIDLKFSATLADPPDARLSGTLKSPFGAPAKWSGVRQPPPSAPKNPVALSIDDRPEAGAGDEKSPATAPAISAGEWPTELESDRLNRPLQTGGNVLLTNATVFTGSGEPRAETSVLVKQGKIAAVGRGIDAEPDVTVIDCAGRFLTAGLIDTHSHIMFADGAQGGVNESTQSVVPEVRVRDVVRTLDPAEYRALAAGVTAVRLLHGSANVIGGQDAVVKLKFGDLARDQLLSGNPQGVKFALGENVKFQPNRFPTTRLGVEATLQRAFLEALDYRREWNEYRRDLARHAGDAAGSTQTHRPPPRRDLRLEALSDIVDHQKFVHCHSYRADEILMLLRVASGFGVRVWSLQHVLEGYKIAPEIAAHGASCSTFADWWAYKVEAFDATPYNAALLLEAGANVALKSDDAELLRHLNQDAAKILRYGDIAPDAALRMVTLNSAKELGLDARLGSIETGKDADLALFSGHPLNAFSRCEMTFIDGEVRFVREKQPSAMSSAAAAASAKPPELAWPSREIRAKRLDLGASRSPKYAIVGATLHPVDGPDVPDGLLMIEGEKISYVGPQTTIPDGARRIEAAGLHVYPGLIDAGSVLGLIEIGKVRETHDYHEAGQFQPDLRTGVALNPDSELIPVSRAGGITAALIRPTGGIICGQASLMQLDGWTAPDMVLDYERALQIDWPGGTDNQPRVEQLREFLNEGRTYWKHKQAADKGAVAPPIQDPRYEALGPYLRGEKRVLIEANSRKEIAEALLFAEKEKLKIVVTGAADAWKLASELKKRDVPVIVGAVMSAPREEYDPLDASYANPGRLHEAGVPFCIRSNSTSTAGFSASNSRNMPFEAAMAVAYGLPETEALKAITLNAARILGVDDRLGSLAAGKLAHVIITDGSPLQPSTQYKAIFVSGRPHAPESRHTRLYEKYRARLHEVQGQAK
ncbi:MAG: amidohydrolase family protein [Planctomycetaceae bacterium]